MGRSQETFLKKQREKKREKRKQEKKEKKELRKSNGSGGAEIDWDSAPVNETLTNLEKERRANNNKTYNNENRNS